MTLAVLAPDLDRSHARLLRSFLIGAGLSDHTVVQTWEDARAATDTDGYILSVGKAALDLWHQWGLIQVGMQRGQVFTHDDRFVMVVQHPGTLMQQSWTGRDGKHHMKCDLQRLKIGVVRGDVVHQEHMHLCGRCQNTRVKGGGGRSRPATRWVAELDDAGLCEEHYRTRGKIKSKWVKKRVDKSKAEAQIVGQLEGMPGDGTRVMVPKS